MSASKISNLYVDTAGKIRLATNNKLFDEIGQYRITQVKSPFERSHLLRSANLQLKKIKGDSWIEIVCPDLLHKLNAASVAWRVDVLSLDTLALGGVGLEPYDAEDSQQKPLDPRFVAPIRAALDLDKCEWQMVENLHLHDAALMIQSVIRGNGGRKRALEEYILPVERLLCAGNPCRALLYAAGRLNFSTGERVRVSGLESKGGLWWPHKVNGRAGVVIGYQPERSVANSFGGITWRPSRWQVRLDGELGTFNLPWSNLRLVEHEQNQKCKKVRQIVSRIQRAWRCGLNMHRHLALVRALREIELRMCRMRYRRVIEASLVIHKAWSDYKCRRRMKILCREQTRKEYLKLHGLDELFAKAIDLCIETDAKNPAWFVSNYMAGRYRPEWN